MSTACELSTPLDSSASDCRKLVRADQFLCLFEIVRVQFRFGSDVRPELWQSFDRTVQPGPQCSRITHIYSRCCCSLLTFSGPSPNRKISVRNSMASSTYRLNGWLRFCRECVLFRPIPAKLSRLPIITGAHYPVVDRMSR